MKESQPRGSKLAAPVFTPPKGYRGGDSVCCAQRRGGMSAAFAMQCAAYDLNSGPCGTSRRNPFTPPSMDEAASKEP